MDNEFVVKVCSITEEKCNGGCNTCRIAKKERDKNVEEAKDRYRFNGKTAEGGYPCNDNYTVIRIKPGVWEDVRKAFGYGMVRSFLPNELILNMPDYYFMYPEWIPTMVALDMKEPDMYIYEEGKPLIACYKDFIYMIMPIFKICKHEYEAQIKNH